MSYIATINGTYVYGIYIVDVTKCTKNINTSKENLGDYDIVIGAWSYNRKGKAGGYANTYNNIMIGLFKNLAQYNTYNSTNNTIDHVASFYGCSTNDIQELSISEFGDWVFEYLSRYVNDNELNTNIEPTSYSIEGNSYGSGDGYACQLYITGMFIVDVTKCTTNLSSKQNKGNVDIVFTAYAIDPTGTGGSYRYRYSCCVVPLLNNLAVINTTSSLYYSYSYIASLYGCSDDDVKVYNLDVFETWFHNCLMRKNIDTVYSDATKINYTDGSYDIVRSVLTESQAKNYAYDKLITSYGSFYKSTESEIVSYYKR